MPGGSISRALLNPQESKELLRHLEKHKVYPYKFRYKKAINNTLFDTADSGGGGRYFTLTWNPSYYTGIVYFGCNYIITPNTTVGTFAVAISYSSTFTLGDNTSPTAIDLEGTDAYMLLSNGAAINDFQVFFPLNWYLEKGRSIYVHVWADTTTCTAGTSTFQGQMTFGTLVTDRQ